MIFRAATLGIALIGLACTAGWSQPQAQAQTPPTPAARWVAVADAQGGVWRLDTRTGELERCTGSSEVKCATGPMPAVNNDPLGIR